MKRLITLKKIGFVTLFCLLNQTLKAQDEFIFIWQATDDEKELQISTNTNYAYNYTINWGDGSVENDIGDAYHTYLNNGNYTVTITGAFPAFNFKRIPSSDTKNNMVSIEQWGNNQWKTMEGAFYGLQNLVINSDDIPDLSQCTNLEEMFAFCFDINNGTHEKWDQWNISNITDMNGMFSSSNFNKAIGSWNTSNVTDMSDLFLYNDDFNQDIKTNGNSWNVSNVTDMERMFTNTNFSQDITNWNVSKVTNMNQMFQGTTNFQQQIGVWNVGNLLTMDAMFNNSNFNQPLNNWNVSKVTRMFLVFGGNLSFNQPLDNWDVSSVTTMSSMFSSSNFNQPLNDWNVGSVVTMDGMFSSSNFNQPLNNWNTQNVENMWNMFQNAAVFDQDISDWNVAKVTSCLSMFNNVTLSVANYEALLIGWNNQNLSSNVSFHGGNSKYASNDAEAARLNMINSDNWTITDGGKIEVFTWTGAVSTDWNTAGNWDTNSVPTVNDNVILADVTNAPRVNFNQTHAVNNLTVNENLTIKNNAGLTVNGNLDQGAIIQVESFVNGNGSFILRGNQTNINPADLIYLRYVSGNNWHLFSSPATGIDIDVFAAATALAEGQNNNRGIGFYDNNTNPRWTYYQNGANDTGNFIDGKGYSLQTSANAFLILTGKLKSTDLSNYVITENLNGWNLVGNPYPANINANVNADANENFLTENADQLDPAFANIYLWNPSTTSYEPIGNGLGAKYIAPGQAFFVKSKNGGGAININKSMLTHQIGNLFLKENETKKIVLKIDDNTNISETTIAFKNGMTLGLDTTYDAAVFSGESTNLSLYTHLLESNENVPFGIQFLPELENNDFIIPLGIAQNEASEITLSLKETSLPADQKIYIEDRVQNTFTEISNVDYKFSHQNDASETGRFFLHFQQKALNTETFTTNKIAIYKESESSVQINGAENGFLNIYTLTGKKVFEKRKIDAISKSIELPKLAKGLYLFEVKTNSRRIVKKIIF